MSLRTRIAGASGLAVAVAVLILGAAVWFAVRAELRGQVDAALRTRARPILAHRGGDSADGDRDNPPLRAAAPGPRLGGAEGLVQLVRRDGRPWSLPGRPSLPVTAAARVIARRGAGEQIADREVAGLHVRVLTIGRAGGGAVQVARPLDEVDAALRRVLLLLGAIGLAGIAVAAALGGLVARTALAPIARFTRRTEAIADRPALAERIEVTGSDELARLARSFNATLDALARSVEAQRHLVADASHELRTPLASLRANVQVFEEAERLSVAERASLRADVLDELDELSALVADVVELARGARPDDALDDVRLDLVVTAVAERSRRRAGGDVELVLALEPTVVRGDPERLGRAVSNLLDNARKWSPPGGRVEVSLTDGVLAVRDEGPGFAPDDLPRVFERFFRAASARSRPGSGLGLAIVRQTAEQHGGWAGAENAPDGGARVRVSFGAPVAGAAPPPLIHG